MDNEEKRLQRGAFRSLYVNGPGSVTENLYIEFLRRQAEENKSLDAIAEVGSKSNHASQLMGVLGRLDWYLSDIKPERQVRALLDFMLLRRLAFAYLREAPPTSPNGTKFHRAKLAEEARAGKAKANIPKELALQAAIEGELNGRTVYRRYKEADAMLSAVNKTLSGAGFGPVKRDALATRLKSFARSERPRKKSCAP